MHKAKKRFGQNFLTDDKVIDNIIKVINPKKDDNILEIGAGRGALTLKLLSQLDKLNIVEIDTDLIQILKSLNKNNLIIHQKDVLKFDLTALPTPVRVVGNLPYNISSPILFKMLENKHLIKDMVFMLQKEVTQRLVAKNNNKTYGRLSVMMQAFFEMEMVFNVPAEAFEPVPKVESAIIYLKPLEKPLVKNIDIFAKIVKAAFAKRRKTLKNCLKGLLTDAQTSIDLSLRAENLTTSDFVTLTKDYQNETTA